MKKFILFSLEELIHMPTLSHGIWDDLKWTGDGYRVWLMHDSNVVTVEARIGERWVVMQKYEAE